MSDSEPSEDNLEEDQIMALIPKKFGKKKFLKGVEETAVQKKKKIKKPKEKKPPGPNCIDTLSAGLDVHFRDTKAINTCIDVRTLSCT